MKKLLVLLTALALALSAFSSVFAQEMQPQIKSEVVMKVGSKLHLFHSGTADVRKEICVGDVIPVYRELPSGGSLKEKKVGSIKVLKYIGEHYIEAEVVSGEIKVGDIAKKETAACMVSPQQ